MRLNLFTEHESKVLTKLKCLTRNICNVQENAKRIDAERMIQLKQFWDEAKGAREERDRILRETGEEAEKLKEEARIWAEAVRADEAEL